MKAPSPHRIKDVIVVGGGPSGSTAARRLALFGRDVILLEKASFPRYKSCGGAVTEGVKLLVDFDLGPAIERTVSRVVFSYRQVGALPIKVQEGLSFSMVMRSEFDSFLLDKAKEAGAEVVGDQRVVDLTATPRGVRVKTHSGMVIDGSLCIGADGATSRVARLAGIGPQMVLGVGLSAELRLPEDGSVPVEEVVRMDFGGVSSGYRWIFPKKTGYSIGVCTKDLGEKQLKDNLSEYIVTSRILNNCTVEMIKAHPIPFFGPGRVCQSGRVLLVGDAAGLTDPLTGEGILPAIKSAIVAAECVDGFLKGGVSLSSYSERIGEEIIKDYRYAAGMAGLFFRYPWLSYLGGVGSHKVGRLLADVMMGKGTYEKAFEKLRASRYGKLGRLFFHYSPRDHEVSRAVRVAR